MAYQLVRQFVTVAPDASVAEVRRLLQGETSLLGAATPLPMLYEEVLRARVGKSVQTQRFRKANTLVERIRGLADGLSALEVVASDPAMVREVRLLAATLCALASTPCLALPFPALLPTTGDDIDWLVAMMAHFPREDVGATCLAVLEHLLPYLTPPTPHDAEALPSPLVLLGFLKGLADGTLTHAHFGRCVLEGRVLHPGVAPHRPWRALHRLLDYLGLSADLRANTLYRQLVARIWPDATPDNWQTWLWVTSPGGPESFHHALRDLVDGRHSIMAYHALKYAPLPSSEALPAVCATLGLPESLLLCWLRPELRTQLPALTGMTEALEWLRMSNQAAVRVAYAMPAWWAEWCRVGMPAVREALHHVQALALPSEYANRRYLWLERYLLPDCSRLCANLLLAQASTGEGTAEILALAEEGDLAAISALGMVEQSNETMLDCLRIALRAGGRPMQSAARAALDRLARNQGLSGGRELERQHLLAAAWEQGPLSGERVRVGWRSGVYQMRLSLHAGKVALDVLGPRGHLHTVPQELRQSDAYRQAREAQREVQQQYRLFKRHLEQYMLDGTPFSAGEFRYLLSNPIFAHLAERLLWNSAEGQVFLWTGPNRWETLSGDAIELTAGGKGPVTLTLVHPVTLAHDGSLVAWQLAAADRRLMQPFKQLFREVYTVAEENGARCGRFAGCVVDPQRAYAVLRASGYAPGNGVARREWPLGVTAHLCWAEGAAGRDLFGPHRKPTAVTGEIWFTRGGEELPLREVDPAIFSETLRTADLLTTRAYAGDAALTSRETVNLRASLLRQVTRAFDLTNIAVPEDGQYALVLGEHATYRVNLVNGTVLLEPEGRQITVPRNDSLWQPVEESDASTEILSIILTLAHDASIADLTFLAQLPAVRVRVG